MHYYMYMYILPRRYRYRYLTEKFGLTSGVSGQAVLLLSMYVLVIVLAATSDSFCIP